MKTLHMVAFILLVVGGLNWLLVGLFDWDLVMVLLGGLMGGLIAKAVYVLVGLAAVYEVVMHRQNCKVCGSSGMGASM